MWDGPTAPWLRFVILSSWKQEKIGVKGEGGGKVVREREKETNTFISTCPSAQRSFICQVNSRSYVIASLSVAIIPSACAIISLTYTSFTRISPAPCTTTIIDNISPMSHFTSKVTCILETSSHNLKPVLHPSILSVHDSLSCVGISRNGRPLPGISSFRNKARLPWFSQMLETHDEQDNKVDWQAHQHLQETLGLHVHTQLWASEARVGREITCTLIPAVCYSSPWPCVTDRLLVRNYKYWWGHTRKMKKYVAVSQAIDCACFLELKQTRQTFRDWILLCH